MVNNIAIIGLGSIGARYLRLLRKFGFNTNIIVVRSGNGIPRMEEDYADKIVYSIKDAIELGIDTAIIEVSSRFICGIKISSVQLGCPKYNMLNQFLQIP